MDLPAAIDPPQFGVPAGGGLATLALQIQQDTAAGDTYPLLEKRYNQVAKVLGTITIIIAYMVIAGYQFKGGGRFIAILSDGSISPETGRYRSATAFTDSMVPTVSP